MEVIERAKATHEPASYCSRPKTIVSQNTCTATVPLSQNGNAIATPFCSVSAPDYTHYVPTYPPLPTYNGREIIKEKLESLIQRYDRIRLPAALASPLQASFFAALVAHEFCNHLAPDKRETYIRALGGSEEDVHTWCTYPAPESNIISWAIGRLNRNHTLTALVLGELLGLKPENCFSSFPGFSINNTTNSTVVIERIPSQLHGTAVDFTLKAKLREHNLDGTVSRIICQYTTGSQELFVFATARTADMSPPVISLGATPAPAHLLARDLILKNPGVEIYLCTDLRVAIQLISLAKEGRLLERTGIVVSGFFGGDEALKPLIISDVAGHNVTILSTPGQDGWESVTALAKRCTDHGSPLVSIFPWPIIPKEGLAYKEPLAPEVATLLCEREVLISEVELPSRLAERVRTTAIPFADLQAWKRHVGLVSSKEQKREDEHKSNFVLVPFGKLPNGAQLASK